ncbi:MAG TPA: hypothetical protein VLX12_11060, partial [Syntrophorhabdales bacterium]|nr:hypothetical protein [Syntrophorhabdales bacterium]
MKRYRKWFFTGLIILAVELGCVALLNYIVDPNGLFRYGTWRHDISHQYLLVSKNFIKTRYIVQNPRKFDCLIFGSSRVNYIDVSKIKAATCYNMTYAAGLPRYHLDNLRYMLAKGVRLKIVLIGFDEFSYKYDPSEEFNDYLRYPYPPVVHKSTALFYLKYLVRYSSKSMNNAYEGYRGKRPPVPYDHYGTGLEIPDPKEEARIDADPVTYAKDPKFLQPLDTKGDRMEQTLEEIRETVDLLRAHGIRLIVFMNPIHKTTYLDTGLKKLFHFEKELSTITSFYDFNGLNSITTNNANYFETNHYRFKVGALIIARIFNDTSVKVPADFGVLVTKENIDEHLTYLRNQVAGLRLSLSD